MKISNFKTEIIKLVTFNFVGAINTAIDFSLFFVFIHWLGVPITIAQISSYSAGIFNSYFMNRKFTFKSNKTIKIREVISFLTINVLSLVVSTLVLNGMVDLLTNVLIAKAVATCFAMVINYTGQRFFTFRQAESSQG